MRNELMINELELRLAMYEESYKEMKQKLSLIGLTTEELQGIHELIGMQIKLISELQSQVECDTDVVDLANPINALTSLVSLVSKPTD